MHQSYSDWLDTQVEGAAKINATSDLVHVTAIDRQKYIVVFSCKGLVRQESGDVTTCDRWVVHIHFPDDYLSAFKVLETLCLVQPSNALHPNFKWPAICPGNLTPGTELIPLIYQIFSMITYHEFRPNDALDQVAAKYARDNMASFPIDQRPMFRATPEHATVSESVKESVA